MTEATRIGDYFVYTALADATVEPIADLRVGTDHRGRHCHSGLRYRSEWLRHPSRFALNPAHAPLTAEPIEWISAAVPAVIDELLPGDWERAVLARACDLDVKDLHAVLSVPTRNFPVGAVGIAPAGSPAPALTKAPGLAELKPLARHADDIDTQPSNGCAQARVSAAHGRKSSSVTISTRMWPSSIVLTIASMTRASSTSASISRAPPASMRLPAT
ncbi:MAG: hypothetical protein BRD57_02370 [Proteobacteria bacterium SW_6_67_9]|nr:MAG: hypothetical protein BRD57_02370 [Proteobacteria bacterium SW_6_67_9]